ncbi:MAG: hypothetical protein FWE47_00685 [Oscillospiraceae bacterium]|nr:hypothetical protein [Oscillospiraceae bacterium]
MKSFVFFPSFMEHCFESEDPYKTLAAICSKGCDIKPAESIKHIKIPMHILALLDKYGRVARVFTPECDTDE